MRLKLAHAGVSVFLVVVLAGTLFAGPTEERDFEFGEEFDGLHVTGEPFDIDVETYRLTVSGNVDNPLSLTFEEVKALPAVEEEILLVCPGYFTDEGVWTGVLVRDLLEKAGIREDAEMVIFSTPDDSYRTRFPVSVASGDEMLVAYEFDGDQFHPVHGFPLRLVAGGQDGSNWVKWLQKIVVE